MAISPALISTSVGPYSVPDPPAVGTPDGWIFQPLETGRFVLRALAPADAEDLHRLVNDWEVVRMLARLPFPYPRPLADEFISSTRRQLLDRSGYHLAITERAGGAEILVGAVGLRLDRKTPRVASLGYWVGRPFWGRGVATEAAGRLARWAMANLDLDRLVASADRENPASAAVLRRIGFREVGEGRESVLLRGGRRDVKLFAASRDDLFGAPDIAPEAPVEVEPTPAVDIPARRLLLVAACALIDSDGRVLLARRPEGRPMAGLWEFPGGKLATGETPEDAVIRELREELGIDVEHSCLAAFAFASHPYERFHLLMPLFLCRRWRGTPQPREGQTLAWVRPARLADYDMPPADKPLIPLLRDFL